jgi:hypothetical protein
MRMTNFVKAGYSKAEPVSKSVISRLIGFQKIWIFTLRNEEHLDEEFLRTAFEEVSSWVTEQSGLNIPADQLEFDIYDNSRGHPNCQGKIAYRGPVSPTSGGWPKIKLDLTADERLVLPSIRREVFHPYTDRPEGGMWANCYAYEEAFGEKLRALGERTRPRDLYDVVNLYRHTDSRPTATVLLDVLRQKCEYKAIPVPARAHPARRRRNRHPLARAADGGSASLPFDSGNHPLRRGESSMCRSQV